MKHKLAMLAALSAPAVAFADPVVNYTSLVTAATGEVTAAVAAGVVLFGITYGLTVGIKTLKRFSR